jgi:acyl CoA:acetate/3-ketoacid CoA transferase beta subunit
LVPRVGVRSTEDGRRTRLLTDLALFSIGDGGAVLEAIASHASIDDVRARTGFAFREAESLERLCEPNADVLAAIRRLDPDNLRAELVGQLN